MPYQAIQLIFAKPLGITETSSANEREAKLLGRLRKLKVPELLCSLNQVFSVNFDKSDLYLSLTEEKKNTILKKMVKQLIYVVSAQLLLFQLYGVAQISRFLTATPFQCFPKLWVLAIDDGEFIDDESWPLVQVILEMDMVYIVMMFGSRRILNPIMEAVLQNSRIRRIDLISLSKWYHAGIACQFLDVRAIPAELEK